MEIKSPISDAYSSTSDNSRENMKVSADNSYGDESKKQDMASNSSKNILSKKNSKRSTMQDDGPPTDMFKAAQKGDTSAFQDFVNSQGIKSLENTIPIFQANCVHLACANNRVNVLDCIVRDLCRDDPTTIKKIFSKRNFMNMPPALVACRQGSTAALLYLISLCESGVLDYEDVIDAHDIFGNSAMDWCITQKNAETVEILVAISIQRLLEECKGPKCSRVLARIKKFVDQLIEITVKSTRTETDAATELSISIDDDPMVEEAAIDESLALDIFEALIADDEHVMFFLVSLVQILNYSQYFKELGSVVNEFCLGILNCTGGRKANVMALVAPIEDDEKLMDAHAVIEIAFDYKYKELLCHEAVLGLLFDKWDPMGSMKYFGHLETLPFAITSLVILYSGVFVLFLIPVFIIRPWMPALFRFSQHERGLTITRYYYHIPFNRWMSLQITNAIYATLYGVLVFTLDPSSDFSTLECILLYWSAAALFQELVEVFEGGLGKYSQDFWNICDIAGSSLLFAYLCCRLASFSLPPSAALSLLDTGTTVLGVGGVFTILRVLSVFELNPSVGPLLWTLVQVAGKDVPNFLILIVAILGAFTVCFWAMFTNFCIGGDDDGNCVNYNNNWAVPWQSSPQALFAYLVTVFLSQNGSEGFEQKYFGLFLSLLFSIITIVILLNVFIAMLSDTFSRFAEDSEQDYRFNLAKVILEFKNKEGLFPPVTLVEYFSRSLRRMLGVIPCVGPIESLEEPPLFDW